MPRRGAWADGEGAGDGTASHTRESRAARRMLRPLSHWAEALDSTRRCQAASSVPPAAPAETGAQEASSRPGHRGQALAPPGSVGVRDTGKGQARGRQSGWPVGPRPSQGPGPCSRRCITAVYRQGQAPHPHGPGDCPVLGIKPGVPTREARTVAFEMPPWPLHLSHPGFATVTPGSAHHPAALLTHAPKYQRNSTHLLGPLERSS